MLPSRISIAPSTIAHVCFVNTHASVLVPSNNTTAPAGGLAPSVGGFFKTRVISKAPGFPLPENLP